MADFTVDLDRSSPIPLYHQMSEQIHLAIQDGTLEPVIPVPRRTSPVPCWTV